MQREAVQQTQVEEAKNSAADRGGDISQQEEQKQTIEDLRREQKSLQVCLPLDFDCTQKVLKTIACSVRADD